jgi:3-dehydroquinate synthase
LITIEVAAGARPYPVWIGRDLLGQAGALLAPFARAGRLVIVTDENVWAAQGERLVAGLGSFRAEPIILPPGEASKSWPALEQLIDRLAALGVERTDHLVAFGGGMIGDLAGFAAAMFKRGCPYVQLPTSLLAQVDSSVGGKTAINTATAKNLVGAFHQPAAVLIDTAVLGTLPACELHAGYAEIVKYGLIGDPAFFAWCEAMGERLLAGDEAARLHAIETSIRAKAAIVAADERDTEGRRALLNFGHTFGHALELESGYALLHGEAVALGMALAFRFSARLGLCPPAAADRATAHLAASGLPTTLPSDCAPERLLAHMGHDKKAAGGGLTLILTRGIGQAFLARDVSEQHLLTFLTAEAAGR